MAKKTIEEQIQDKNAIRNGNLDIISQNDWIVNKCYLEIMQVIKKIAPNEPTPYYDKYLATEELKKSLRAQNNILEAEIKELEKQL